MAKNLTPTPLAEMTEKEIQTRVIESTSMIIVELAYLSGLFALMNVNHHDEIGSLIQSVKKLKPNDN